MRFRLIVILFVCLILFFSDNSQAQTEDFKSIGRPIIMLIADKMDSLELYHSKSPAVKRLLSESACALMNIRSGSGYTNTNSAYLTLGSGNRSVAPGVLNGAYSVEHTLNNMTVGDFWSWSTDIQDASVEDFNLLVPEIGWIYNQAETGKRTAVPGLLGSLFRKNGWKTVLIGNIDSSAVNNRPAGLLLMDERGIIDQGDISEVTNVFDPQFPYGYRFNSTKVKAEIQKFLAKKSLIIIEFGDFARLDSYREEITPAHYASLKKQTWRRFDSFLGDILKLPKEKVDLILLSPSLSKESWLVKNGLAPLVIRSTQFSAGLLTSGTTHWDGLVANLDILPTLSALAGLKNSQSFTGKPIKTVVRKEHLRDLDKLHSRIDTILINQRPMIDWFLGLLSFGWGLGCLLMVFKRIRLGGWLLFTVAAVPLGIILLPLLPTVTWNLIGFLGLSCFIGILCIRSGQDLTGIMKLLAATLWIVLTVDQMSGWNLMRFSALGYSAASGARYYGIGNEYMGIYLAVALLTSQLIVDKWSRRWPAGILLLFSILILGWPRFGINFGGTLSAMIGFAFYLFGLFKIGFKNKKFWMGASTCIIAVLFFGIWDAFRPQAVQTHVGMFFRLFASNNYNEVGLIIIRKLSMNLKLLVVSPWSRIILYALALGIILRFFRAKINKEYHTGGLVWQSIIVSGIAAFFLNDSGVVALGTCLAFGFSFYLIQWFTTVKGL